MDFSVNLCASFITENTFSDDTQLRSRRRILSADLIGKGDSSLDVSHSDSPTNSREDPIFFFTKV